MKKKIAVLIRDRQAEAMRMGLGLTILNDQIDIYLMRRLESFIEHSPDLDLIKELGLKIYTFTEENRDFKYLSPEEGAQRLLDYDIVLAY